MRGKKREGRGTPRWGGAWRAALALVLALGASRAAAGEKLLVVSVGESYASGEGTPDVPATGCRVTGPGPLGSLSPPVLPTSVHCGTHAQWKASEGNPLAAPLAGSDALCHRSALAGPRLAADALRSFVTSHGVTVGGAPLEVEFVSLACSGAQVPDLISRNQHPGFEPQLEQVKRMLGSRPIDALVMSIGGNDAGFAAMVLRCIATPDCTRLPEVTSPTGEYNLQRREQLLTGRYTELATFIREQLPNVRNVLITEYPNPMFDDSGALCAGRPRNDPLGGITRTEAEWAARTVIPLLNSSVEKAARTHGWRFLSGVSSGFATHGYCANDRFLNTLNDSIQVQGGIPGGTQGTGDSLAGGVHPNRKGHQVYRDAILAGLRHLVPPGRPSLVLAPRQGAPEPSRVTATQHRLAWAPSGVPATRFQVALRAATGRPLEAPLPATPPARSSRFGEPPHLPLDGAGGWSFIRDLPGVTHLERSATGTVDYVVRACSDLVCSPWSEPARLSNNHLRRLTGLGPEEASAEKVRIAWEPAGAQARYQVAFRSALGGAWKTAWVEGIAKYTHELQADTAPAEGTLLPRNVGVTVSGGGRDATRVRQLTLPGSSQDYFVRPCGAWACTPRGCEPTSCGEWSEGLRVASVPPARPALSVKDEQGGGSVQWSPGDAMLSALGTTVYQLAVGGAVPAGGGRQRLGGYHYVTASAGTRSHAFESKPPLVLLRACNDAGCSGWSEPVQWNTSLIMLAGRVDPLNRAPIPARPANAPGPREAPPAHLP